MKYELKNYRYFKAGQLLKSNKYSFIYFCPNLKTSDWTKIEQKFSKNNMTYYRVYNSITKLKLEKSIFKHNLFLINGPIIFIFMENNRDATMQHFLEFSSQLKFLAVKVDTKFYVKSQVEEVDYLKSNFKYTKTLNYLKTSICMFYNLLYMYNNQLKHVSG